jgi:hypothetical protein
MRPVARERHNDDDNADRDPRYPGAQYAGAPLLSIARQGGAAALLAPPASRTHDLKKEGKKRTQQMHR